MADKIRVHTDRIGADADRIQGYIGNITKEITNMKQSVTVLTNMWEGPGRSAFHKAFWDDMDAIETMVKNLKAIYDYDMNAKKQYEQCGQKVASLIGDIRI